MALLHWDVPQSPEEWGRWNAKVVNKTTTRPHVEIRTTRDQQDILIAVGLTGEMKLQFGNKPTEKCNVRISSKLPIKLSFGDWEEMKKVVEEAVGRLEELEDE